LRVRVRGRVRVNGRRCEKRREATMSEGTMRLKRVMLMLVLWRKGEKVVREGLGLA
jgi:hypothetical protein